jgi:uncharacterized SAM-binding protein YcdF (DUF218 family)
MFLLYLKTAVKNLFLPPAGPLIVAFIGVLLIKRRPLLGRTLAIFGLAVLWSLSTPIIADSLARLAEYYPPLDMQAATGAQAIVILGGGGQRQYAAEYAAPAAGPILLERLSYGAYLAHKTGLPVLVTGAWVEAAAMHDTLSRNFAIETRWIDNRAYDTFGNARNSAQLLRADGVQRIILVTHATHMRRSVEEFKAAGLDVTAAPTGIIDRKARGSLLIPSAEALSRSYMAVNELIGEPVRQLLEITHLRKQLTTESAQR